tara:strand:+ start:202 stop:420 length:219 start_codon:yes stop_codon:yes gene_type:complete
MSTIIIPGGGMGFNLIGTAINLAILYFLFNFVRQNFSNFKSNKPFDVVKVLRSMNVDVGGLFAPAATQENTL